MDFPIGSVRARQTRAAMTAWPALFALVCAMTATFCAGGCVTAVEVNAACMLHWWLRGRVNVGG